MKMIIAVLRPEQLPAVKNSIHEAGVQHFSAIPIQGTAPKTEQLVYRGVERQVSLFKRVRLEIVTKDPDVENVMEAISKGAKESGGHGRVFVLPVDDVLTIWTGEKGDDAF
ncbi:MAG: nitrogen regulatory protein PII [Planctomycetota bacterium]|jgi:nitrogen regulatory protein PII